MDKLPIVLVSRGRQDFLCVTLSSLLSQINAPKLELHLLRHEEDLSDTYLLSKMKGLAERTNLLTIRESLCDITKSLAHHRANAIQQLDSEWVLMLDNDVWFPPTTIHRLISSKVLAGKRTIAICGSHVDIDNERQYPDFTTKVYRSVDEYRGQHKHTGECFQRYDKLCETNYSHTHALWHIPSLKESGVLDFWLNYPVGVREYDYQGSLLALTKGYRAYIVNSKSGELNNLAFWHLWNRNSDKGYFDVKGQFPV